MFGWVSGGCAVCLVIRRGWVLQCFDDVLVLICFGYMYMSCISKYQKNEIGSFQ